MRRYFCVNQKKYVVRFFDANNISDFSDLVAIVNSPGAQQWMDNVSNSSVNGTLAWMEERGQGNNFLFAIADMEDEQSQEGRVHGFVYVYPREGDMDTLEISYARRQDGASGLVGDGIHLALELVMEHLVQTRPWVIDRLKFVAEIERKNYPSIKVAEKAGFVKKTGFDSKDCALWYLQANERLINKERGKSILRNLERVKQNTGSYCGPASVQILASHFGVSLDQEKIVDAAGVRETIGVRGVSVEQMARAIKTLMPGYSVWLKTKSTLEDIEKMVRVYNYPVAVDYQGIFEETEYADDLSQVQKDLYVDEPECKGEEGHYSVVIDLDRARNTIRIMDPYGHYANEDRFFGLEDFNERWWDDRMDYFADGSKKYFYADRLMFAIVPKGVRAPEGVGMREI